MDWDISTEPKGVRRDAPGASTSTTAAPQLDGARLRRALLADLRELERLFAQFGRRDPALFARTCRSARERALAWLWDGADAGALRRAALVAATQELVYGLRAQLVAAPDQVAGVLERSAGVAGISCAELAGRLCSMPGLLALPTAAALKLLLTVLYGLAPLRSVSLWCPDSARAACVCHVGQGARSRRARALAQRLLAGERPVPASERSLLLALPVGSSKQPAAALVGSARPGLRRRCQPFLCEALPLLRALLEREVLLSANVAAEQALVASSERKLTRLGFDLHDGPIQEVALLAQDVRLFGAQLERLAGAPPMRGRIEDLESQLAALDGDLRRIAGEVQAASVLLQRPFAQALEDRAAAFAARTKIEPRITLQGDVGLISSSQQIALLNIVHEALANIREHARAGAVEITVAAGEQGVRAQIRDDGRGFELEPTLMRAARAGRVGLVAINERVRLLGGQCRIDSRRGGPTTVSVVLPRWQPAGADKQASASR